MASQGYYDWLNAGKPYTLVRPLAKTQANIRQHGLTVYDYPDDSHLLASKPEDHTPFSYTGWPNGYTRWKGRAIDIMPRDDSDAARHENTAIALQMIVDKDDGYPGVAWLKYINYTDENGDCWHVSWQPNKVITSSTDSGHVHASGRSDMDDYDGADGYDPVARMNGDDMDQEELIKANTATPQATGGRRIKDFFGDGENLRNIWMGEIKKGDGRFPADTTPLAQVIALPDRVTNLEKKIDQIIATLAGQSGSVDQATVVAALRSSEGQAAISAAVEYSEDH